MLALLGIRRDECKLPIEVIIQFHSICSFACIDYTTLANQSNASRRPVLPQHPSAALDAGLSVLESTHSISALWAQLLLCCLHRDFVCLGVPVSLFGRARALSWACRVPYPNSWVLL